MSQKSQGLEGIVLGCPRISQYSWEGLPLDVLNNPYNIGYFRISLTYFGNPGHEWSQINHYSVAKICKHGRHGNILLYFS